MTDAEQLSTDEWLARLQRRIAERADRLRHSEHVARQADRDFARNVARSG